MSGDRGDRIQSYVMSQTRKYPLYCMTRYLYRHGSHNDTHSNFQHDSETKMLSCYGRAIYNLF